MEQYAYERLPRTFGSPFASPVRLEKIEVIGREGNWFFRVTDGDGDQGVVQGNPKIATGISLVENLTAPFFLGKDLRNLYEDMVEFYRAKSSYKFASVLYWNVLSHLELASLDLLGKKAGLSAGTLLGRERRRDTVPVYLTNINRRDDPRAIMDYLRPIAEEYGYRAVKFKIGGRMSHDGDAREGWTEAMLLAGREAFDESTELYVDANSSYTPGEAVRIGKRLQELNYRIFEEPIEWNNIPGHKIVADALDIPVATGEQETNLHNFAWLIESGGADIIQPDVFYVGGLFRTMLVCDMASAAGLPVMPHSPKIGPAMAPMLLGVSLMETPGPFQECLPPDGDTGWFEPSLTVVDGTVKVPDGPGLGVTIAKDYLEGGEVLFSLSH